MNKLREYLPPNEVDCVVYHAPCSDGFGGAYVFWKYIKETRNIDDPSENDYVRFIPYNHNMSETELRENILPRIKNRNVLFIDVCPNASLFLDMLLDPKKCVVLDHHESALKTTEKFPPDTVFAHCFIDQTHSGCILAHQYCNTNKDPSLFLKCIEDRDLWKWELESISRPFTEAFYKSVPFDFKAYEVFEDETKVYSLVEEGKLIAKYTDVRVMELVKTATDAEITIDGTVYAVYIINTGEHVSDIGHVLAQSECTNLKRPCDFALIWYYDESIGKIKVSLRSDGKRSKKLQTNVSSIARYFGGGGHPNASGFTLDQPGMFLNILTTKNVIKNIIDQPSSSSPSPSVIDNLNTRYGFKVGIGIGVCVGILLTGIGFIIGSNNK
jgi:uncharacterized protein